MELPCVIAALLRPVLLQLSLAAMARGSLRHARADAMEACFGGAASKVYSYESCCACGNEYGNSSGRSHCWVGPFDLSYCCTFYASDARLLPHLPCWRDADGPKRRVQFELAGREWTLWQKPREPSDTRGVMAHVMWPSAYALAAWVLDKTGTAADAIAGRHVLELGCGLALPSLAAALGGAAKAQGTDIDRDAVQLARRAARANLPEPFFSRFRADVLDFRDAASLATVAENPSGVDTVLISGQLYEGALSVPLLRALQTLCSRQLCMVLMVFWISIEFSQTQIAFLDRMGQVGFKVVDDFACRERGYANPGSMYECYRFEKAPPLWI
ncbi:unnamed protein product [Symbiodinium sp. KB8]|nr:unnamed protein product [Symbiodinium sp. KB8]